MLKNLAISGALFFFLQTNLLASQDKTVPQVDVSAVINLTPLNRKIDAGFYGLHLNSYADLPAKDVFNELEAGKVRIGGNEYDVFNWRNKKSMTKYGGVKDLLGFDDFEKQLQQYNLTGIYQVNLMGFQPELVDGKYVLQKTADAQSAFDLIKKYNGEMKLHLKHFSLGNEFSIWNETHSHIWPDAEGISADEYIDRFINFAILMRKAQEEISGNPNDIQIWGPEISTSWTDWNSGNMKKDCKWDDIPGRVQCRYGGGSFDHFVPYFLYRLANAEKDPMRNPKHYKLLDYFSFHYYPNFRKSIKDATSVITDKNGRQLVAEMLESTQVLHNPDYNNKYDISSYRNYSPKILGRMKEWIKNNYPDVKLAMNEFALDSDYRTVNYHPIVRPLYLADSLAVMATQGVDYFNFFLMNAEKNSNLPWVMLKGDEKTNLFYTYKLFSRYFRGNVLSVSDDGGDEVNVYALAEKDSINVAIINKKAKEMSVQISTKGMLAKKMANYKAPPWSATILRIPKSVLNKHVEVYQYGAQEMGIPVETIYEK